jgi:biotin synthase-like enzyme
MDNHKTASRLSSESQCISCPKKIEVSRFLWSLNKGLNLPQKCSYCALAAKRSPSSHA